MPWLRREESYLFHCLQIMRAGCCYRGVEGRGKDRRVSGATGHQKNILTGDHIAAYCCGDHFATYCRGDRIAANCQEAIKYEKYDRITFILAG